MSTFTINIPFPAWDGIESVANVVGELRRNEFLAEMPKFVDTPRRITLRQVATPAEGNFDDCLVVVYWWPGGFYATAMLGGQDSHYGMTWQLLNLRLRWRNPQHGRNIPRIVCVEIGAQEIKAVELASSFRSHLVNYEGNTLRAAEQQLLEAEEALTSVIFMVKNVIESKEDAG